MVVSLDISTSHIHKKARQHRINGDHQRSGLRRHVDLQRLVLIGGQNDSVEPTGFFSGSLFTIATQTPTICISIEYTRKVAMRDPAINLRALPEQRDLIDHAATLLGKNRSDFMLEAACERAQSVLLDQVFFELDAEKFKQFTALLDAPPSANVGLIDPAR